MLFKPEGFDPSEESPPAGRVRPGVDGEGGAGRRQGQDPGNRARAVRTRCRTIASSELRTCLRQPMPRGVLHYPHGMSSDTKWLIGTGVAIVATIVGSAVAIITVVVTLVGDVRADLRDIRTDLTALTAQVAGVNTRIDDVRADLRDMRTRMDSFDARLRAVEVALGKVDQRLLTIERVVLPPTAPGE